MLEKTPTTVHNTTPAIDVFQVRDGALVDLEGLIAVSETANRILDAQLARLWPEQNAMVLVGLEPDGKLQSKKKTGVPGLMSFDAESFQIMPGTAVVTDQRGYRYVIQIHEPQELQLSIDEGGEEMRTLALCLDIERAHDEDGDELAYEIVRVVFKLLNKDEIDDVVHVPLAQELQQNYWLIDTCRWWQPNHPDVQRTLNFFDILQSEKGPIWGTSQHGKPWKNRVLGREWKTYQTKAAVAVSTAGIVLAGRAMSSYDRAQLLTHLYWQLQRSVEKAATYLRKWIGGPENAGIYASIFSPFPKDWDAIE